MAENVRNAPPPPAAQKCCGSCAHFCNEPAALEAAFPGMTAMSSGYASVRFQDGLCGLHEVYLSYRDICPSYAERSA